MNYLAHLFLSCSNEDLLIGNFIADSITNKDLVNYNESIQEGIKLHRLIDSYTDQHALVLQGVHRLHPFHHKYAPVVIDILYDYLLANNWERYSGQKLDSFAKDMYEILNRRMTELPKKLQKRLPRMIEGEWLQAYKTEEGIRYTLSRMDLRTSFPSNFAAAIDHLQAEQELYEAEFNQFFPQVIAYVEEQCGCS